MPSSEAVAAWPPTRSSAPLSVDHPSLFRRYERVLALAWQAAMGYPLDGWQCSLLHAITEEYPAGHRRAGQLRWRRVLISLARQNGKSEIAAALGLLFLLASTAPLIIGIASSADQARLVYRRAMLVITRNRSLRERFDALTDTRGIRSKTGGTWEIKAAKSAALQGPPITLGIVDEVHLVPRVLWTDLVNGTGARPNTLVAGITTAGDDSSVLLRDLYDKAEQADPSSRLGFFIWEAPEPSVPDDDETLGRYLACANPAVACGRVDLETAIADVRDMPEADAVRYRLNRFTSSVGGFMPLAMWGPLARDDDATFPGEARPVLTVDRTPEWSWATVTATVTDAEGVTHTQVVASIAHPDLDRLERVCLALANHRPTPAHFVMDGYALRDLGKRLERRGLPVQVLSQGDVIQACSVFYAAVAQGRLRHAGDPLLARQLPGTVRKSRGTGFRVARRDTSVDIDAVMSTVMGVYVAETVEPAEDQLFI